MSIDFTEEPIAVEGNVALVADQDPDFIWLVVGDQPKVNMGKDHVAIRINGDDFDALMARYLEFLGSGEDDDDDDSDEEEL